MLIDGMKALEFALKNSLQMFGDRIWGTEAGFDFCIFKGWSAVKLTVFYEPKTFDSRLLENEFVRNRKFKVKSGVLRVYFSNFDELEGNWSALIFFLQQMIQRGVKPVRRKPLNAVLVSEIDLQRLGTIRKLRKFRYLFYLFLALAYITLFNQLIEINYDRIALGERFFIFYFAPALFWYLVFMLLYFKCSRPIGSFLGEWRIKGGSFISSSQVTFAYGLFVIISSFVLIILNTFLDNGRGILIQYKVHRSNSFLYDCYELQSKANVPVVICEVVQDLPVGKVVTAKVHPGFFGVSWFKEFEVDSNGQ